MITWPGEREDDATRNLVPPTVAELEQIQTMLPDVVFIARTPERISGTVLLEDLVASRERHGSHGPSSATRTVSVPEER